MASEVPPSITVVIGDGGTAISTSQNQGPLVVSEPMYVKPATVDAVQVIPVAGDATPLDHLAAMRVGSTDLVRYRAVSERLDGTISYLQPTVDEDKRTFLGIVLNPSVAGRKTTVCIHGAMSNAQWNWQPGPVHCETDGVLTQNINQNTFQVAYAVSPTTLLVGGNNGVEVPSSTQTVVWEPPSASTNWTIVHNLQRYPSVTLVDSAHSVMLADITYVDINTITVEFAHATSGYAYLV